MTRQRQRLAHDGQTQHKKVADEAGDVEILLQRETPVIHVESKFG